MQHTDFDAIFIVGNSRSGTTMMSRILGIEPSVFRFNELHFFDELWSSKDKDYINSTEAEQLFIRLLCIQRTSYLHQKNPGSFSNEVKDIIASIGTHSLTPINIFKAFLQYETLKNEKTIPCEQTGRNIFYIAEILENFSKARIINMIRDPRAVLLSQKYKWKRGLMGANIPRNEMIRSWFNYSPITISMIYKAAVQTADRFATNPRVYSLYYEELLNNPEHNVRNICNFTGLTYSDNLLAIPNIGSSNKKDEPDRKGIDKERTKSWQIGGLNTAEIYLCQTINKKVMLKHNYNFVHINPNIIKLTYYLISFPIKSIIAFFLNLKRMKNIRNSISRRLRAYSKSSTSI
ncbi:MAG: sulfotransferase [Candidatus Brocadia sp.]|nr:sulfotransferase [Candidatus Brocadia sp.]